MACDQLSQQRTPSGLCEQQQAFGKRVVADLLRDDSVELALATGELRQLVPRGQATYAQPPATRSPFERARDATRNVGEKRHALHPNHFRASTRGS